MPSIEKNIRISVVVPILNEEEENIIELCSRLRKILSNSNDSYEVIFVDDGSKDEIFSVLQGLHNKDKQVKIVRLARNFGQAIALLAGFEYAKGEIIVTIDSDLQCLPEDMPKLVEKIDQGYALVSGWRRHRCDPLFTRKIPSFLMNEIMSARTGVSLHDWGCAFNAGTKEIISQLGTYGENARFIKPILTTLSKSIIEIQVECRNRKKRGSKYSIFQLIKNGLDFLIHYSLKPAERGRAFFTVREIIE